MALIGFARVSTKDQSLITQLEQLQEAGCQEIFHGKQSGASKENENKLQEMISYIRKGDAVIVTKIDRLGRSLKSILATIEEIHAKGASLRSLDGAIDTSNRTPYAEAQLALLATFGQLERDLIKQRTSEGRERAMDQGVRFGRPPKLTAEQQAKVIKAHAAGESINKLHQRFGVSRMTISRILEGRKK